jgi:hypothetical protein
VSFTRPPRAGNSGGVPLNRVIKNDLVIRADFWRAGRVVFTRPPLTPPSARVAGKLNAISVVRPPAPPWQPRTARFFGPIIPPLVKGKPPDRAFTIRASAANVFRLRAAVGTMFNLRSAIGSLFNLRASEAMSVPSNLSFFQGEDIQLNFALTPPTDITGWTLTGTVQNKLGGTTAFTFTPSIVDAGRGWFQAGFARAQTSNLSPGDYVWDVRRTDSGKNAVLAHGEITLKQPVTP